MKLFKLHKPVLVFSHSNPDVASQELGAYAVPFKQVSGQFEGKLEASFVVPADRAEAVLRIAEKDGQDFILHLDEYRKASLIVVDTRTMLASFGQWQAAQPRPGEDNTFDPVTGTYYVVR
jgi:hypothetical protein